MASYNRVILIGRLTKEPELKYTTGGLALCTFSIAVDRRFKNQQGEKVTDFFNCTAWRQKAEFVSNYIKKGALVCVEGTIEIDRVAAGDGTQKSYTKIICDNVEPLQSARSNDDGGSSAPSNRAPADRAAPRTTGNGTAAPAGNGYFPDDDFDDSDPFADQQ